MQIRWRKEIFAPPASENAERLFINLEEWKTVLVQQIWILMENMNKTFLGSQGIEDIREYLRKHFHEEISLAALSERFHFSPQYISKKFKETYNP